MKKEDIILFKKFGWGGRIRTYGTQDQNLLPYHLATPHYLFLNYNKIYKWFKNNSVHSTLNIL